ncbi:cytochrome c oxidase assembly protein [uncultured Sphingomonas sp.]|uniref:cytochrome c oxidase assembly protein n=1 Tax=uncultured Sphingomonas sp. TaxID=158754 RepID=UPI00262DF669|nr:cytochrome c oxidase assembly protein [uncultured Sphingomonas sp.]
MMRVAGLFVAGVSVALSVAHLGMTGHMLGHMLAVAVAAPMLAWRSEAGADRGADGGTGQGAPLLIAALELVVVWSWHLPAARAAADGSTMVALAEQAMFLGVGFALWRSALVRPAGGVAALLLTSMHMTLLGVLIGLAPRALYAGMAMHPAFGLDALADQQLGGVVMLVIGGASYCLGGLWMLAGLLRYRAGEVRA